MVDKDDARIVASVDGCFYLKRFPFKYTKMVRRSKLDASLSPLKVVYNIAKVFDTQDRTHRIEIQLMQ